MPQKEKAEMLISFFLGQPFTRSCQLYGSLASGEGDIYSDIDLQLDVSGHDNAKVLLMLPWLLARDFPLAYTAFGPRFAPELYLVSFGFVGWDIFHFVDIECLADPHHATLSKDEMLSMTDFTALNTKLLLSCLKRHARGQDYAADMTRLAVQMNIESGKGPGNMLRESFLQLYTQGAGPGMEPIVLEALKFLDRGDVSC